AAANSAAAARELFIRSAPFRHRLPFPTNEYAPLMPAYAHSSATFPHPFRRRDSDEGDRSYVSSHRTRGADAGRGRGAGRGVAVPASDAGGAADRVPLAGERAPVSWPASRPACVAGLSPPPRSLALPVQPLPSDAAALPGQRASGWSLGRPL